MHIGCTNKLLKYIQVEATAADTSVPPMLRWSANMVTIDRRRTIVVGNDSSRYGFVLYGIRAKDIKNLGSLILDGIRSCLEAECIAPELIERYLDECGSQIVYTKMPDRSVIARLNQLCARITWYADEFADDRILQNHVVLGINADYITAWVGDKRAYVSVEEQFASDISTRYGVHPYRCKAAELEVELELESTCTRRIVVPLRYTFRQLHLMIQRLFCWQGYHLHDFWIEYHPDGRLKHTLVGSPREFEIEGEVMQPDWDVQLSEVFPRLDHIIYNYDFGDNWIHHIRLEEIIEDYDKNYPVLIEGEGDAPPEDAGGPIGYAHLMRVLDDPDHPSHFELKAWFDRMRCAPFDIERINQLLKSSIRVHGSR